MNKRANNLPTGTVTFFFSDIEDSTRLWETYPQGMRAALARHDEILRTAVEAHNGLVIKTTGDGLHAVFPAAQDAVQAATTSQKGIMAESWPSIATDAIRVRIGIHTGEAEERDGDYFGPTVNRAARIMAIGHGGQVLLSSVTAALCDGHLQEEIALSDLGEVRLRGLNRPEHVYQVFVEGLPGAFPPLRTEMVTAGNLPPQLTSFIGREKEKEEVFRLLSTTRLLTLTGPGGTGKTRLSLEAAGTIQDHYAHGVWLVELAPLTDPAGIRTLIAELWGLRGNRMIPLHQVLADYLHGKEMLLILDNCEHLVAACAQLAADLLAAAPRLTILASSREGLGVPGETTYHLPTLRVPGRDVTEPESLSAYESVQLFMERARSAKPGFALTPENASAVGRIVRRLDGIPLAIELAAARLKLLPPGQLAERLDDRFRLLTGGSRTALPRQQTLRALIDWSYEYLDPGEQALFRQLGVFAGGWSLEAAEAVADLEPENLRGLEQPSSTDYTASKNLAGLDVIDLLANLVNKSLVIMEDEVGVARFHFLETIRQYARDRLFESRGGPAARDRHLDFFFDLVIDDMPIGSENVQLTLFSGMGAEKMMNWVQRVRFELDNVRAAVQWAMQTDPERALTMSAKLPFFFVFEGPALEAHQWLDESLLAVENLEPVSGEAARLRTALLLQGRIWKGNLLLGEGRHVESSNTLHAAAELAREWNFPGFRSLALALQGITLSFLNRSEAYEVAAEALAVQENLDNPALKAMALDTMLRTKLGAGDFAESQVLFNQILDLVNERSAFLGGMMLISLARIAMQNGRIDKAEELLYTARDDFTRLGSRHFRNITESEIGHLKRFSGDDDAAEAIYRRTVREWQDLGHQSAVANQLETFAFIAVHRKQYQKAAVLLGAAESLRGEIQVDMLPEERTVYDEEVTVLRKALGVDQLNYFWQRGRELTMDTAVDLALATGGIDENGG